MRLTLRTLLAYLDGILEPNDAEDLAKKIEESEYAAALVHRIRDVMRRLRLGAPSLGDRGPGLDPNTVAEYLDNTLLSERVTDFEKVCLDSDIHLAEVASSHQILTLVLGEPAEVDPAARQRMYLLKETEGKVKPPPTPAAQPAPDAKSPQLDLEPDDAAPRRKPRPKPTVPEYLREPRKRSPWWAVAAAVLLAICFTGVVLAAFGLLEPGTPGGNLLARLGIVSESPQVAENTPANGGQKTEDGGSRAEGESGEQEPGTSVPSDAAQPPAAGTGAAPESLPPAAPPAAPSPDAPPQTPEAAPSAVEPPPAEPGTATQPPAPPADVSEPGDAAEPDKPTASVEQPPPLQPEPLGRLMSGIDQVLLGSVAMGGWSRVAANQMLVPQELLAPPTYRPKIALTMGVTMEILGGSRIELLGSTARDLPGIRILYGRVVLMPLGKIGSRMRLAFGNRSGVITFTDPETVVALDVRRVRVPGSDPENGPARIAADLYAATGGISWEETVDGAGTPPLRLAASHRLSFDANLTSPPAETKELPPWIESLPLGALDRRASASIAEALPSDRLARVGLMELAVSRPQREVKWLALRCLGYVGQFDDMALALDDSANKLLWSDYVDELRAAVGRDPESAAAVRLALEKQFPQQAGALYRMLWGYTNQDLQAGLDTALVRALDDDLLAVRVLAYWNLRDITGQGAAYQPELPAARRQQSVRRWRQRLDAKEIRYPEEAKEAEKTPAPPPSPENTPPGAQ